ncbi:sensor domain-containing protein [Noviherbaspirillum cavernae]|nr:EAL domain-containing protein [Noviherbaspirillum cavernae]
MTASFDFHHVFNSAPVPAVVMTTDLIIADVNEAFLATTGRARDELLGVGLFTAFPPEPGEPEPSGAQRLLKSIQHVMETRQPDTMALQRYAISRSTPQGTVYEERFWTAVNTPIFDAQGNIEGICHSTTDVTELHAPKAQAQTASGIAAINATPQAKEDLFTHAQTVLEVNRALDVERSRLRHLFDQAPGFVAFMHGPEHVFELVNQAFYRHVGQRDLIGKPIRAAMPELEGQGYFELIDQVYRTGEPFVGRDMLALLRNHPDGVPREIYVDIVFQPITGADGRVSGIVVEGHDITAHKRIEDKLRESDERWKFILEGSDDGLWDWDLQTNDVAVSDRLREILGYAEGERILSHEKYMECIHPDDRQRVKEGFEAVLRSDNSFSAEYRVSMREGVCKWVHARGKVVSRDARGRALRICGAITDISEQKHSEQQIWRQANFDALTGLPNRSLFRERLEHEVKLSQRTGLPIALFFIDLDRFKEVNDLLGHDVGDVLLTQAAQRISRNVRASDTVARLGGDEFTVILPGFRDAADVQQIAQKIIDALAKPFRLGGELLYISGSIGITLCPLDSCEPEDLLRNADQAMYVAKNAGRNQFSFFTPSMQKAAASRLRLIADLREALPRGQFKVLFQPIIDLSTNRIVKAEALLRWHHPEQGLCHPSQFIPLAEETGLIHEIGSWVFMQSAAWSQRWSLQRGEPFQISVNKSPVQFLAEDDESNWAGYLAELGISRNSISIEITEGVLLNASASVTDKLLDYRDAGIQVALDDFGTGYSSMSYLKKFDIDYLKIDQSFVQDMPHDQGSRTIAETMIMMAHKLGLKVIAEGIETEEQRVLLAAAGCDFGQGFLFARALEPEELEGMLRREAAAV